MKPFSSVETQRNTLSYSQEHWIDPAATDMDDESRQLIEQMLAEEEYYYGQDSLPPPTKKRKGTINDSDYTFGKEAPIAGKKSKREGMKHC